MYASPPAIIIWSENVSPSQINFNFSFPHLGCEYATVDATNFMGTHEAGLASRVSKVHLDKNGNQIGPFTERKDQVKHDEDEPPLPHREKLSTISIHYDSLEEERRHYQVRSIM